MQFSSCSPQSTRGLSVDGLWLLVVFEFKPRLMARSCGQLMCIAVAAFWWAALHGGCDGGVFVICHVVLHLHSCMCRYVQCDGRGVCVID